MAKKPSLNIRRALTLLLVVAAVSCGMPSMVHAQTAAKRAGSETRPEGHQAAATTYQDDQIELRIPRGWTRVSGPPAGVPDHRFAWLNGGIVLAKRKLLLEKDGYILSLAYDTEHASGVDGGRFGEVFNIPWPSQEDVGNCSLHLYGLPMPASRTLLFFSLIVDTGVQEADEACGISKELSYKTPTGFVGERRWLAGYFTTAAGGWFFPSAGEKCGLKAYALTSNAKTPEEMPDQNDPKLRKTIQQAIDIVDSIRYKRCAPSGEDE